MLILLVLLPALSLASAPPAGAGEFDFPRSLDSYDDAQMAGIGERLVHRIKTEPFNLVATLIFFCAIVHTFLSARFMAMAHHYEEEHRVKLDQGSVPRHSVSHRAELFHFLGEVEVIFGLWVVVLGLAVVTFFDWNTFVGYLNYRVNYTEAMFIVVIMTLASTRPILRVSEAFMGRIAGWLGGTLMAWWLVILTIGPALGSLITEPAAMTICALLLAQKFYVLEPSEPFKYATIGLLFVNISVGGTFTHFSAPPVLMVAGPWGWDTPFMMLHFGWKAAVGTLVANGLYFVIFRNELKRLQDSFVIKKLKDEVLQHYLPRELMEKRIDALSAVFDEEARMRSSIEELVNDSVDQMRNRLESAYFGYTDSHRISRELAQEAFEQRFEEVKLSRLRHELPMSLHPDQRGQVIDPDWDSRDDPVPGWVTLTHVFFLLWTIINVHNPALFIGGLLFFLGFAVVTSPYQNRIDLKPALLVGFFLAGLVTHGGFQGWWIEPVLGSLSEVPLKLTATALTAFNDNAAITYLTTLIPGLSDELKYAVVSGAVAGGGLTVIANAPNPAGQALLKGYFANGVSPIKLLGGALFPTLIMLIAFFVLG